MKSLNPVFRYVHNDLMSKIRKNSRGVKKSKDRVKRKEREKERKNFRSALDLKEYDIIITKEDSIISKIVRVFAKKKIYKITAFCLKILMFLLRLARYMTSKMKLKKK